MLLVMAAYIRIMFENDDCILSITGGYIRKVNGAQGAFLSGEDLNAIMEALDYIPPGWRPNELPPDPLPLNDVDIETIWSCVQESLNIILLNDVNELARRISPDGEVTVNYIDVAKLNIEHYTMYDLSKVELIDVMYQGFENTYSVIMRDANDKEFYVFALYGEDILEVAYVYNYTE